MDILFLLVPMSVVLALLVIGVFAFALHGGQFDDVEGEGARILLDPDQAPQSALDLHQVPAAATPEQSLRTRAIT
jgi:cbb3-type cytochrome oxidase maturation protein